MLSRGQVAEGVGPKFNLLSRASPVVIAGTKWLISAFRSAGELHLEFSNRLYSS